MQFGIFLFIRIFESRALSKFAFQANLLPDIVGINVGHNDILQNFNGKDDIVMDGTKSWWRFCQKIAHSCKCSLNQLHCFVM